MNDQYRKQNPNHETHSSQILKHDIMPNKMDKETSKDIDELVEHFSHVVITMNGNFFS